MDDKVADPGYAQPEKLELIWGEGFMSPGGPGEVAHILGGHSVISRSVLDIGSGLGGADVALVMNHGAGFVTGVEVQPELVERATRRAARLGLTDRIRYQVIAPGPLPFADASFDAVFSKDALLHVRDKPAIYREAFRVLRSGGLLVLSDWLRGPGADTQALVDEFIAASSHDFHMVTLPHIADCAALAGFALIETEDRGPWYLGEAKAELERLNGATGARFAADFGQKDLDEESAFWQVLVRALEARAMCPGHLRAVKPG